MRSMDAIGIKVGTDKSRLVQDYLRQYERLMQPFVGRPITILEIGVHNGASLSLWRDYFPQATIIAVDIEPSVKRFERENVTIEIGSQYDGAFLSSLASRYAPDIIIDDGSHIDAHQIFSFEHLFGCLKPGGLYVVEDIMRSPEAEAAKYFNTINMHSLTGRSKQDIASVACMRGAVAVWKSETDDLDKNFDALAEAVSASATQEAQLYLSYYVRANGGPADIALNAARRAALAMPGNPWPYLQESHILEDIGDEPGAITAARIAVDITSGKDKTFLKHLNKLTNVADDDDHDDVENRDHDLGADATVTKHSALRPVPFNPSPVKDRIKAYPTVAIVAVGFLGYVLGIVAPPRQR